MGAKDPTKPTLAIKISGAKGAVSITNTSTSTYADTKGNRTSTSTDTGMTKSKPSLAVPMGPSVAKKAPTKMPTAAKAAPVSGKGRPAKPLPKKK